MSLMHTLSEINNNMYKVKRIIKLNKRNFYHKNVNYFILVKLAIFSGLATREQIKINKNKFFSVLKFIIKLPFFLISKFLYYFYLQKNLKKTDVIFFQIIIFITINIRKKNITHLLIHILNLYQKNILLLNLKYHITRK